MSARGLLVLIVLLLVLGGGALIYQRQQATERPQNAALLGKPVLKDLRAADIAVIRIVKPKGKISAESTLTVQHKDDGWAIRERQDFPADVAKVREFVVKMIELKIGQSTPIDEKDRARLQLDDPGKQGEGAGTLVEFDALDGKPLAKLLVGKKYFKRDVENPDKAPADGRFVALPEQPGTAYIVSDPLAQASTRSADWIDRTSFEVEKVKTLEVRFADGSGWKIARSGDNADWTLEGAKPGEKVDTGKANSASYSLSLLELADVAPKDAQDTGLDKPTVIQASTLDGLSYTIRVGKPEGDNYYVAFSASGSLPADAGGKDDAERIKKLKARLPIEKRLSDYVLLIPKSKLDDTLKPRSELLEKKPETRKK